MDVLTVNYIERNAAALFCQSLKETGFAILTNHPIKEKLIKEAYHQWQQFFNSEKKYLFQYQKPSQDGYFPFRTERAKNSEVNDLKEFYHFYTWGKIPENLQNISLTLFQALTQLATQLLNWVEDYLPDELSKELSMPLKEMITRSPNTLLRILHYPPLENLNKMAVRAAPHEDINLITLLPTATAPGLEVLDSSGHWHPIVCNIGNIVVNVGDMLQMCTKQYYRSTTHRVVNPTTDFENVSRYSMPLFLHPNPDVILDNKTTAKMYLTERLMQIGIY